MAVTVVAQASPVALRQGKWMESSILETETTGPLAVRTEMTVMRL